MHPITYFLATLAAVYISTSMYYLIRTQCIGTPFKDQLTLYPKLKQTYDRSVEVRRGIYNEGILLSIVILIVVKTLLHVRK